MANLQEIVSYLDGELRTADIKDFPGAFNGLQLTNNGRVDRVVAAVDASLKVVEEASKVANSLLIVHHGMFWQGVQMIDGPFYEKMKMAMDANLAIYSSHLPLDVHPELGNNVLFAKALGLQSIQPILIKNGVPSGVSGIWRGKLEDFCEVTKKVVNRDLVVCDAGERLVERIGIITGGAGSSVSEIAELGLDVFVTGEGSHWTFIDSEERRMNTIYAGHYATEVFGVKKLSETLGSNFKIDIEFIQRNGGL